MLIKRLKRILRTNSFARRLWTLFKHIRYSEKFLLNEHKQFASVMLENEIDLVLDLGANVGQFACDIRASGYTDKIISFEPDLKTFELLLKKSQNDKNWAVFNFAISNNCSKKNFYVASDDSLSSSLNRPLGELSNFNFNSKVMEITSIESITLDIFANENEDLMRHKKVAIKLDIQGHELAALEGAKQVMEQAKVVYCEISFLPLYDNQPTLNEITQFLNSHNFHLTDFRNSKYCKKQLVQADVIYTQTRV